MSVRGTIIPEGGGQFGQEVQGVINRLARDVASSPFKPYGEPTRVVRSARNGKFGELILVDPSGGAFTITLTRSSTDKIKLGSSVGVVNVSSSANTVTVQAEDGNINGSASQALAAAYFIRQFIYVGKDSSNSDIWIMPAT